jgi:hypothetical protein
MGAVLFKSLLEQHAQQTLEQFFVAYSQRVFHRCVSLKVRIRLDPQHNIFFSAANSVHDDSTPRNVPVLLKLSFRRIEGSRAQKHFAAMFDCCTLRWK